MQSACHHLLNGGVIGCPDADKPNAFELGIRNTFVEWIPRPEAANRRASSFPPTRKTPYTRIELEKPVLEIDRKSLSSAANDAELGQPNGMFPTPAMYEVLGPSSTAIDFTLHSSRCLARLDQQVHRAPILDPREGRLPSQTLQDAFDDDYGLHPSHPLWDGQEKIMLRNVPCRCKAHEIESFITARGVSAKKWSLVMPAGSYGRNRGYAFITPTDLATATQLLHVLWQQSIPTRGSQKTLKLMPAAWMAMTTAL